MSWVFGVFLVITGILNILLIHPVPGIAYLIVSLIYLPPATYYTRKKFRFSIPVIIKFILAVLIIQFTFGVSDLAELYGL